MAMATGTTAGTLAGCQAATGAAQRYYRRFTRVERVQHAFLMLTFVGCALSGLPLLYADKPWAATLARILGGFEGAGLIHRICAFVMIVVFVSHLAMLVKKALAGNLMKILWGPDSMVPQLQDGSDIVQPRQAGAYAMRDNVILARPPHAKHPDAPGLRVVDDRGIVAALPRKP